MYLNLKILDNPQQTYSEFAPRNEALLAALLQDIRSTVDVLRQHRHTLETEAKQDKVGTMLSSC